MKKMLGLLLTLGLSFWVIRPLFSRGYFPMHDDTQVARVVVMGRALKEGQFPVRWVSDLGYGYGYPIYNFYGPLPYYVGGILYGMGVDSVVATKIMFGVGAILASLSMYLLLEPTCGLLAATTGAMLFSYAPYHAVDIYVRGAVGEYWAIAFLPLILLGFVKVTDKKGLKGIVIGSLGLAGAILSHTILGYLTTGMVGTGILLYWLISLIQRKLQNQTIFRSVAIVGLGLGISAFFWLPAFWEMGKTGVSAMITGASTSFFDHFVCLAQLWNSPWGYGGSAPGCADGMSFKLGKPEIVMAIASIIVWAYLLFKKRFSKATVVTGIGVGILAVSLFGVLDISKPIWSVIPYVSFIQYPWRLLSFTILALGIVGVFLFTIIRGRVVRVIVACTAIGICILVNAKVFQPQYIYLRDSKAFESPEDISFRVSKISDEYLPQGIPKPTIPANIVREPVRNSKSLTARVITRSATETIIEIESAAKEQIQIQQAYFPGWIYIINGHQVAPTIARSLPSVVVSEGKSVLEMRFTNTPVRTVGNIISIISVALIGGIIYYGKKANA